VGQDYSTLALRPVRSVVLHLLDRSELALGSARLDVVTETSVPLHQLGCRLESRGSIQWVLAAASRTAMLELNHRCLWSNLRNIIFLQQEMYCSYSWATLQMLKCIFFRCGVPSCLYEHREKKKVEHGDICIMGSFITCVLQQVFIGVIKSREMGWGRQVGLVAVAFSHGWPVM
jgi:hypothetical protein